MDNSAVAASAATAVLSLFQKPGVLVVSPDGNRQQKQDFCCDDPRQVYAIMEYILLPLIQQLPGTEETASLLQILLKALKSILNFVPFHDDSQSSIIVGAIQSPVQSATHQQQATKSCEEIKPTSSWVTQEVIEIMQLFTILHSQVSCSDSDVTSMVNHGQTASPNAPSSITPDPTPRLVPNATGTPHNIAYIASHATPSTARYLPKNDDADVIEDDILRLLRASEATVRSRLSQEQGEPHGECSETWNQMARAAMPDNIMQELVQALLSARLQGRPDLMLGLPPSVAEPFCRNPLHVRQAIDESFSALEQQEVGTRHTPMTAAAEIGAIVTTRRAGVAQPIRIEPDRPILGSKTGNKCEDSAYADYDRVDMGIPVTSNRQVTSVSTSDVFTLSNEFLPYNNQFRAGSFNTKPALQELFVDQGRESFPRKLYRLLKEVEKEGRDHIISFTPSGKAFKIHKPIQFMEEIAPKYFRNTRIKSFKRQLNLYGFRSTACTFEGRCSFSHEFFVRGKPELLGQITREYTGNAAAVASSKEDS